MTVMVTSGPRGDGDGADEERATTWCQKRWKAFLLGRGMSGASFTEATDSGRRSLTAIYATSLVRLGYKWESVRKALAEVNNMCQLAGLLPPAFTTTNPLLRRLQRTAKMAAQTQSTQHKGLPLHIVKDMWLVTRDRAGTDLALPAAAALGWFFLLRPGEITGGPITWRDIRFAFRAVDGQWTECMPWEAEVILMQVRRKGGHRPVILARWRSGDKDGFCPVLIASELFHQCLVRHAEEDDEDESLAGKPAFGSGGTSDKLRAYVKRSAEHRGLMGCDAYSLRVGGAQHLGAHIRQHGELHLAGGWAQGSPMPLHYAGASIEATRWWAALMVQPVGLLRAGGRPAMHFEL